MFKEKKDQFLRFYQSQSTVRKILLSGSAIGVMLLACGVFLFLLVWSQALGHLPDQQELKLVQNPTSSRIYSADSVLLGTYFIQERSDVRWEQIPPFVVDELIATEDVRFYDHKAIDVKSLFRVIIKSVLMQNESSGGGSTLTQQLAKNLFPRKNYRMFSLVINKFREIIIASRIEQVYSKNEIITLYLNTVAFGDNTYGIEAASQRFFSTSVAHLSVQQGAVLVGMLKATYAYNPRIFPDRAKQRRNVVLHQMEKYGKLSATQADSLFSLPIELSYNKITHHTGLAPYFREYARQYLLQWCKTHTKADGTPYNLYTDGLKIYTTIDSRMQRYAEEAVNTQMALIQKSFDQHWSKRKAWEDQPSILTDAVKRSGRYHYLKNNKINEAEFKEMMNTPIPMNVFTWEGEKELSMSPMDSIKHYLSFLNAGMMAMDPDQGAIKVWVGGINHHFFQYDHVRPGTKRQVGSTFKPIVYAAALENGVRPCEFTSAAKVTYTNMEQWAPENTSSENYDRKFSMEGALAYSVNTVSVKILEKAGINNAIVLARKMGITSDMPSVPSLALGVANISMTELVTAYSCMANGGDAVKPYYIAAITSAKGELLEEFKPEEKVKTLSTETSQMMIHMLRRTVNEGTAAALRTRYGVHNDISGKTGTTQSNADGWFMAMTPHLVIGAWVGADDPRIRFRTTALGQGARTALPFVGQFFQQANKDKGLTSVTSAHFNPLSDELERRLSCDLYKSDRNFIQKIFGKKQKEQKRDFDEKAKEKKGFFKKLFSRG